MANINKVILAGNLTRDPQHSALPSGMSAVEFGMAINHRWKNKDGQTKEDVCFIDCRAYGRTADTINQYMRKGRPILIEGRLKLDQWEGKDGQKRSKHLVVVDSFHFIDSRKDGEGGGGGEQSAPRYAPRAAAPQSSYRPQQPVQEEAPPPPSDYDVGEPGGDHVPF